MFGVNSGHRDPFTDAVPLARAVRVYYDGEDEFPAAWPAQFPGAWVMLSQRPNPGRLLSGRLDAALKAVIASAPIRSELTFWHENTTGNPLHYPWYVNNARAALAMQRYGQELCRGSTVRFGVITCGPAAQQAGWVAAGLGLVRR
jgi:hypothetical protein